MGVACGDIVFYLFDNTFLNIYREFSKLAVSMPGETVTGHFMPNRFSISFEKVYHSLDSLSSKAYLEVLGIAAARIMKPVEAKGYTPPGREL